MRIEFNRQKNHKGFSLIELMFAMFIFTTCLLIVFSTFPLSAKAISKGEYVFLATEVAQKELEYLKSLDWDDLEMSNTAIHNRTTVLDTYTNGVQTTTTFESYPVVSVYETDPTTGDTTIKSVLITVKYDYGSPVTKAEYTESVSLETLVARPY